MTDARQDQVDVVVAADCELGEGPVWDARSGRIVWIDIPGRRVHLHDPTTGATESMATPLDIGAIVPRRAGGFMAALQDGFWILGDGPARRVATVPEGRPEIRFNDGKCDPQGRLWAGTMPYDEVSPVGCLYRLDRDGSVARILDGVTISNGLAWSGDGTTMYYIDTPTRRVDAFSYDAATGDIGDRRVAIEIPESAGWPDGMAIDVEDGLWVALWGGSAVHRYVEGRLDRVVALPVSQPTSCAFGGPNLDELYITSAWTGLDPAARRDEPLAGGLFRIRPGVRGPAAPSYDGI
ncbi:MAG TPA: SMP-30/gluconolactonase/LRE family protein [Candidatus Limnocylindrales bacterium]